MEFGGSNAKEEMNQGAVSTGGLVSESSEFGLGEEAELFLIGGIK